MEPLCWKNSSFNGGNFEPLFFLSCWSTSGILFLWFNTVSVGQGLWLFLPFCIVLFPGVDDEKFGLANSKFTAKTRNKI